jgi:hydrogenase nickel incorporation protein HypA/HybF
MHELSVTESILDIATRNATGNQATRVTDIHITIGALASIVDDSVQFYWDDISDGTICKGATLHFKRIPAIMHCNQCGRDYSIERQLEPCPDCKEFNVKIVSGEEFFVDSIEIEKDPGVK